MPSDESDSDDREEDRRERREKREEKRDKDGDRERGGALAGALRNLSGALGASVASARDARPGPYDRGTARGAEGAVPGARGAEPMEGKGRGKAAILPPPRKTMDRSRTCPFLLRIFRKIGAHHGIEAFAERGKEPVDCELQVYAWPDVTLRELADLIKDVAPEARDPKVRLAFNLIYPDKTGKNVSTNLGTVTCSKRGPDDDKALSSSKFQTGDLLDLAILQ
ncbi:unnamed protein product [Durusdinium trenchii]|uniref:Histone deacetylase complex subunit SAP18 n=2 Tax=Durusdinium trenchii TaxID=1381693 RepID=A0ABP0SW17_9DINO